jgi:hypothetical protein
MSEIYPFGYKISCGRCISDVTCVKYQVCYTGSSKSVLAVSGETLGICAVWDIVDLAFGDHSEVIDNVIAFTDVSG